MKTIIFLEKKNYLLRLTELFKNKTELEIREIKEKIPSASYYRFLLNKLVAINKILANNKPGYFIKPIFLKNGQKVLFGLKKHPHIKIEIKQDFLVLTHEKD